MTQDQLPLSWYRCGCCGLAHLAGPEQLVAMAATCPETGCISRIANPVPYQERNWLTDTDLPRMLQFVEGRITGRKLRLFACACVRRWARAAGDADIGQILSACERFADGELDAAALSRIQQRPTPLADSE